MKHCIKNIILFALALCFSCCKEKAKDEKQSNKKYFEIRVADKPYDIEYIEGQWVESITAKVTILWNELEEGNSPTFTYTTLIKTEEMRAHSNADQKVKATSSFTPVSWRFFKGRDIGDGIEIVEKDSKSQVIYSKQKASLEDIEKALYEALSPHYDIFKGFTGLEQ